MAKHGIWVRNLLEGSGSSGLVRRLCEMTAMAEFWVLNLSEALPPLRGWIAAKLVFMAPPTSCRPCALLVPQRLDGIEVGGFPCGVDAEQEAFGSGSAKPKSGPSCGHRCRQRTPEQAYSISKNSTRDNDAPTSEKS